MGRNAGGDAAATGCATLFGVVFLLFWSSVTGAFDVIIGRGIVGQLRAEAYPTVPGVVTRSELESSWDSDGTTYSAEIQYRYDVAGTTYVADDYRTEPWGTSDRGAQRAIVDRYPVGATVTVHYDPSDPQTSVLETGVAGGDRFMLLFMTPFNLVALFGWSLLAWLSIRHAYPSRYGGVKITGVPRGWRARLPGPPALLAAAATALAVSFVAIFPVAIIAGSGPSVMVIQAVWGLVLASSLGAFAWCWRKGRSGQYDLIVDHAGGGLVLPAVAHDETEGRGASTSPPRLDRERIRDVTRRDRTKEDGDGGRHHHVIVVEWFDDQDRERSTRFGRFGRERDAEAFLAWLRERLGFDGPSKEAGVDAPEPRR